MRFVDINGDREEHYEEVNEYARLRQEEEQRFLKEKKIREWFATELDNRICLRIESTDLIKYVLREVQILQSIFYSSMKNMDSSINAEQLWDDFLLYNLNLFAEPLIQNDKGKKFVRTFSEKVFHLKPETAKNFADHYNGHSYNYTEYMKENFSLEKNTGKQFWRLLYHAGGATQTEYYINEYIKFIYFYALYLYLKIRTEVNFDSCRKELKQCRVGIMDLMARQKKGRMLLPDLKKMQNPLYCGEQQRDLQEVTYSMKIILFSLDGKAENEEGEFKMIEELYRQMQEGTLIFEELDSILPEKIRQEIDNDMLPEFQDYASDILRENEKVCYLDHTVLYQGKERDRDIHFGSYKGILIFTDQRIIFNGEHVLDLDYDDISRITEYDVVPEILEIRSGEKMNYFQLPDTETAYKILKLIARHRKGENVTASQIQLSYEELLEKADINAYIFSFDYMVSQNLPQKLKNMLTELNRKLRGMEKILKENTDQEENIYQFLHYYIPETVKLVQDYLSYQGVGLEDKTVKQVYAKVEDAVEALDRAVYQKILEIYQNSVRDTLAGADALKEILGQDGYVDSSYTMKR